MQPRCTIGASGSIVGFGGWSIGGRTPGETSYGDMDESVSIAAIEAALAQGITHFDTSPAYGNGRSERLIGATTKSYQDDVTVATKVGIGGWDEPADYSERAIRTSIDMSLKRLNRDSIDIVYVHSPPAALFDEKPEVLSTLKSLQRAGVVRSVGVSCRAPEDGCSILERHTVDVFQVNLNMLDIRVVTSGLSQLAAERGVSLIARTPLCFGFLSGSVTASSVFSEGDHRRRWSREQIRLWSEGAAMVHRMLEVQPGREAVLASLRFCLAIQGVRVVLPGISSPDEALINAEAGHLGPLDKASVERVIDMNLRTSFFKPHGNPSSPSVERPMTLTE